MASTEPHDVASVESTTASSSSHGSGIVPSPKKGRKTRTTMKLRKRVSKRKTILDMPEEERAKAYQFDLDGDGKLDEAELAMMRYDVDGDGNLTSTEIHAIIKDLLRDQSSISAMRKIIAGLTFFVFILSLSNLGTSIASALLVKETTADKTTAEMKIMGTTDVMGTQTSAETFEALEMDSETRRARRTMVVESLLADPFGEHAHRRLANNKSKKKCTGKKCDSHIKFDVNYMKQADAENIKAKCEQGRNVNVKRSFPGGSTDQKSLCRSGTTIIMKEKKNMKTLQIKGPRKGKKKTGFSMVVRSGGKDTTFDCDGKDCYMSGLHNAHGEPCNLKYGSDDCEPGLVCIQDRNDITSGTCSAFWDDATWYVDWNNDKCVQNCDDGPNCGGYAGNYEEQHTGYKLCCDTHLGWLAGNYGRCVPDLDFFLGKGRDCTDNPQMCKGKYACKKNQVAGSDKWYCVAP